MNTSPHINRVHIEKQFKSNVADPEPFDTDPVREVEGKGGDMSCDGALMRDEEVRDKV